MVLSCILVTSTIPAVHPVVVATPTTERVLPIPYALPPSIILTSVIEPLASILMFAVALSPVTEVPIPTSLAL